MFMWILFFVILSLIFGMGFAFKAFFIAAGIFALIPFIIFCCIILIAFVVTLGK